MSEVKLTKDNFEEEVINSEIPVLVDFWAPWCNPCRMIGPVLEEIAAEYDGKIKVGKVNVDEEAELAVKYSIMSIPALKVFKGGQIVNAALGAIPKDEITELFKNI